MRGARARGAALLAGAAAVLALAGCSPTVDVPEAAGATAVGCAAVVVRLPAALGSEAQRQVDQQGTAAWGDGNPPAVLLRCGVTSPGPTTEQCIPVDGVDWIVQPVAGSQQYVVTTFGRTPATQVTIDTAQIGSDVALPPISDAVIAAVPHAARHCTAGSVPDATPTPSS